MKKHLLLAAAMLGMGGAALAQSQLETYSVYDVNHEGGTTVADATMVVNRAVQAITADPQMVTAEQLNQVLQMIDARLAALEGAHGISHPDGPGTPETPVGNAYFTLSRKNMLVGDTYTQSVTTVSDGEVGYLSTNPSVATVDATSGLVTAVANGETTIIATVAATSDYPVCSAAYMVVVEAANMHNGHEYVDLGVIVDGKTVLWAKTNIGAEKPADYGDYYAWGETETKSVYDESTYEFYQYIDPVPPTYEEDADGFLVQVDPGNRGGYQYVNIGEDISGTEYDVAHVKWAGNWRMPSRSELNALSNQCDWTWGSIKNSEGETINGYKVSNKSDSSKYIFLPAAGSRYNSSLDFAASNGGYWSSSFDTSKSDRAYGLYFPSDYHVMSYYSRFYGLSVRPVCVFSE